MNAVGADKDITLRRHAAGTFQRVDEIGRDASFILHKAGKPSAGDHRLGAGAFDKCIKEKFLQPAAVDGELRHLMAGMHAAQLGPDFLSGFGEIGQATGTQSHLVERAEKAKRLKLADGMRQNIDADAGLANARGGFIDLHVDVPGPQHQGGGKAADPAAGDDDFHVNRPWAC